MQENQIKRVTDSHEWMRKEGRVIVVGITKKASQELGDIVYIELPKVGQRVIEGEEVVVLESTKAAVDSYAPMSGIVVEINSELGANPGLINADPENRGWLYKLSI